MVSRHDEIMYLTIFGFISWGIGHHQFEFFTRHFCKRFAPDLSGESDPEDRTLDLDGGSAFNWGGLSKSFASAMGTMESFFGSAGIAMLTVASIFNARRTADAVELDPSQDFTGTQLDAWSTLAPLLIWFGWMLPKWTGVNHNSSGPAKGIANDIARSCTTAGWILWGMFAGIQKTRQSKNFCLISAAFLSVLETVMARSNMRVNEVSMTVTRLLAVLGYYACVVLFSVGFIEDP